MGCCIAGLRAKLPKFQRSSSILKWVCDFIDGRTNQVRNYERCPLSTPFTRHAFRGVPIHRPLYVNSISCLSVMSPHPSPPHHHLHLPRAHSVPTTTCTYQPRVDTRLHPKLPKTPKNKKSPPPPATG